MPALMIAADAPLNPLDVAELVVMDRDWAFDRLDQGDLIADVNGAWCNYKVWFNWQEEAGGLTLSCSFDNKLPKTALTKVYALLALVNEKLWLGHFEVNSEDATVMFRHSLLIRDGAGTNAEQLRDLLDIAIQECERFYPAFQSAVWGGKSAAESLEIALFETIAEA